MNAETEQEEGPKPLSRKCELVSTDGVRLPIGEFEIPDGKPLERWANAAFSYGKKSFERLMVEKYSIVVHHDGMESSFPLTRWVKMIDHNETPKKRGRK